MHCSWYILCHISSFLRRDRLSRQRRTERHSASYERWKTAPRNGSYSSLNLNLGCLNFSFGPTVAFCWQKGQDTPPGTMFETNSQFVLPLTTFIHKWQITVTYTQMHLFNVIFQVLTAASMKFSLLGVAPCSCVEVDPMWLHGATSQKTLNFIYYMISNYNRV
jgi:hypothetical protein